MIKKETIQKLLDRRHHTPQTIYKCVIAVNTTQSPKLHWYEKAKLIWTIHRYKSERSRKPWSMKETANYLGRRYEDVTEIIRLYTACVDTPNLIRVDVRDEALSFARMGLERRVKALNDYLIKNGKLKEVESIHE
jgi:hypothetical protein